MERPSRQRQQERDTERESDEETLSCPECESKDIVTDADQELVCEDCGLVLDERNIDRGPEWRAFNHSERQSKSRVGAPITETMHDKGLTTTIDWKDKDAYGRSLSSEKRSQMHRLRKWQERIRTKDAGERNLQFALSEIDRMASALRLRKWQERIRTKDAGERNLQFALSEIDRMASALGVPRSVREVASVIYRRALNEDLIRGRSIEGVSTAALYAACRVIYRRALNEDLIRGRSIEGVSTAALYAACRQEGIPRSLDEVADVSRVPQKEIGRTYRYISQELGLELKPVDPKQFVPRFASALQLSEEVQSKATEIIDVSAEQGLLSGKSPTGFAAAAIYAASLLCNEKKTQREVADVAQVTEVTIRNRYQEQIEAMGFR
ncbi:transcription factor TFIIB cyclin-related protein [Halorubrum aidingense JCM 13560]|uniref:Transcription initiation factor IIB n=1 Tax=Halorubrum aidingense JCM 13560 TaxID=1230454 RepID=M0PEE7_9EURY|nr:TFIIB-type zinc ribbon-containing protein [Halorubrum aidingense]EMA68258.1 transcription factor TFIIB cyclin-related protein [Halorubrum aidingense JCM 13560]